MYVLIGFKNKEIPNINPMLATFEPMIFPMTSPPAFELIAAIEVKSSGAEVATETIVNPTIMGGIPSFSAKIEQLSESQSPPLVKKNNPNTEHPTKKVKNPLKEISLKEEAHNSNNSYTNSEKLAILNHNQLQRQSKRENRYLT